MTIVTPAVANTNEAFYLSLAGEVNWDNTVFDLMNNYGYTST